MGSKPTIVVTLEVAKVNKNSVRFEPEVEDEYAAQALDNIYVPKPTLGALGFKEGDKIEVTITVA